MMTMEEMRRAKRELGYSCQQISEESGVPLSTVQKIFSGITKAPRHRTLAALEKVLQAGKGMTTAPAGREGSRSGFRYEAGGLPPLWVSDGASAYDASRYMANESDAEEEAALTGGAGSPKITFDRQGEYTLEDYMALPEDVRVELIDGVFYIMNTPFLVHQDICFMLGHYFQNFIETNRGDCRVMLSPISVQLDPADDRNILQPDICICCDMEKLLGPLFEGAPDMVIEILSKSTRHRDLSLKAWKYQQAGVKEYWTVDPMRLKITVFDYAHDGEISVYDFHDQVPVGIYGGKLRIDFQKIYDRIRDMYSVGSEVKE